MPDPHSIPAMTCNNLNPQSKPRLGRGKDTSFVQKTHHVKRLSQLLAVITVLSACERQTPTAQTMAPDPTLQRK